MPTMMMFIPVKSVLVELNNFSPRVSHCNVQVRLVRVVGQESACNDATISMVIIIIPGNIIISVIACQEEKDS